jgi:hypothetical protein
VVTWSTGYSRARSQVFRSNPRNVVPARVNRSSQSAKPRLCTSPVSALDSPFIDDRPAWSDSTQCPSQSSSIAGLRDMSRSKSFQSAFAHSSIRNHGPAPATQLRDQGLTEVVPCDSMPTLVWTATLSAWGSSQTSSKLQIHALPWGATDADLFRLIQYLDSLPGSFSCSMHWNIVERLPPWNCY